MDEKRPEQEAAAENEAEQTEAAESETPVEETESPAAAAEETEPETQAEAAETESPAETTQIQSPVAETEPETQAETTDSEPAAPAAATDSGGDILPGKLRLRDRLAARMTWPNRLRPSPRFLRWSAITLLSLAAMATAGVAYATYDYHREYRGRILPGATIAGVEVGGLTATEAELVVEAALTPRLEKEIVLSWRNRSWDVTPRELGARTRTKEAVAVAMSASAEASMLQKARMRVFGSDDWFANEGVVSYPRKPMMAFVRGLASSFDRPARPERIDYSTGWVKLRPALDGRKVRVVRTVKSLRTQGLSEGLAALSVKVEEAKKTPDKFDQILLLRIGENRLYLYEDGKITHEWTVATGQPEYPTPTGIYEITEKRYMPTWVNPDPTGWGASMPDSIPPGPGNPLGLRALNWSAPAIRFHGTSATYSLGYNASHGCVRMANEDVIQLYDMIELGTPIVSTVVAPLKPMYAAAPDPTVVTDPEPPPSDDADGADERKGDDGSPGKRKKN